MKKEDIAGVIIKELYESFEGTEWFNIRKIDINNHYFGADGSSEEFLEGYISFGKNGNFIVIGKFDDKYYTDVDEYYSSNEYFISFGKGKQVAKVTDKNKYELDSGLTVYRNRLANKEVSEKLIELYDKIILSVLNINEKEDFMKGFLG